MPSAKKSPAPRATRVPRQTTAVVDTSKNPDPVIRTAAWVIYFIGALNLILGIATLLLNLSLFKQLGIGGITIISGMIFIALGYFVMKSSLVALLIAMSLVALSTVLYFISITNLGFQPNLYAVVIRIALLIPMYRAIAPLRVSAHPQK